VLHHPSRLIRHAPPPKTAGCWPGQVGIAEYEYGDPGQPETWAIPGNGLRLSTPRGAGSPAYSTNPPWPRPPPAIIGGPGPPRPCPRQMAASGRPWFTTRPVLTNRPREAAHGRRPSTMPEVARPLARPASGMHIFLAPGERCGLGTPTIRPVFGVVNPIAERGDRGGIPTLAASRCHHLWTLTKRGHGWHTRFFRYKVL